MKTILVCGLAYYVMSFVIGIGFLIEYVILRLSHDENVPVLAKETAKINTIVFITGVWLPLIIIKQLKIIIGDKR